MINNHTFIRHENVKLHYECGWKYLLFHNRTSELLQLNTEELLLFYPGESHTGDVTEATFK